MIKNELKYNFCCFILTHNRANNVKTYEILRRGGYTGPVVILIDNEDNQIEEYKEKFGTENVYIFDKLAASKRLDECDNFNDRRAIIYARNECFRVAKELGYKYFCELDDDYYYFGHKRLEGGKITRNLNYVFSLMIDFLNETKALSVCFSQGGDHIGGYDEKVIIKRKAMNSFICDVDRPFSFQGRINEDVNTYVHLGSLGFLFFTFMPFKLDQYDTQQNGGGMTDLYINSGTYVKSFYSVIINPSCVKVKTMGAKVRRLHHSIDWEKAAVCILDEKYKKK